MAAEGAGPMLLGDAVVSVGVDLTKLMAGFQEAKAAKEAFERDMASGSAGLLQYTAAANDAGSALDKQASTTAKVDESTKNATAAIDKMADANAKSATASKANSDALETEAQKNQRLSEMVDRSIASLQERNRLNQTAAGASILGAGVGSRAQSDASTAFMAGMGGAGASGANAAKAAKDAEAAEKAAKALKDEAEAAEQVGAKVALSSQSIREMIVLMREAGRGDFTRMAGSASILAQRLGLLETITPVLLLSFIGLAAATAAIGVAMISAERDASHFDNELLLSGNRAGLTASSYIKMAADISASTETAVSGNRKLIMSLAETNDFSAEQIQKLVTTAQIWAKATGEDADQIVADFAKMADGPTKYAEAFQHAHIGIISPLELNHIQELERRGDKEQAIAVLIEDLMNGIAKNTTQNLGLMATAWDKFLVTLHNGITNIKDAFRASTNEEKIAELTAKINDLNDSLNRGHTFGPAQQEMENQYRALVNQRSALQETMNAQDRLTASQKRNAEQTQRQTDAIAEITAKYVKGIDAPRRYADAVADLNNKLADSVKMARPGDVAGGTGAQAAQLARVLSAAAKSSSDDVRDLATHYGEAVDKIKKANLPDVWKADAKAAREAAAEAKRLANEAARLEERRQQEIKTVTEETAALEAVLPLYLDQSKSLDDINRAKAVAVVLSRLKLTADSAEGKQIADLVGHYTDLNSAVEAGTKLRQAMIELEKGTDKIKAETAAVGSIQTPQNAEQEQAAFKAQADEEKRLTDMVHSEQAQRIINAKQAEDKLTAIAKQGVADRAKIQKDADARELAQQKLDDKKLQDELNPKANKATAGSISALNQGLGGRYKQNDDLRILKNEMEAQRAAAKKERDLMLIDEQTYQDKLHKIEQQGAAKRVEIQNQTHMMELQSATDIADSLASIAADSVGKQSTAYKVLFDISKAFSIAKAALALEQNVAEAMKIGFPQNLPLIAAAVAQGAIIMQDIRAISLSFDQGGYTGDVGVDKIAGIVHGQEYVTNAQATRQYRPILEMMNSGRLPTMSANMTPANDRGRAPNITINDYAGVDHKIERGLTMDDVIITARRIVRSDAPGVVAADMDRPNSKTSKSVQRNTTARRRRN